MNNNLCDNDRVAYFLLSHHKSIKYITKTESVLNRLIWALKLNMKRDEGYLQSECVKWFRLQYPKFDKLLFAVPNGGSRNLIEAKKLKGQGVVAGVSDLILFVQSWGYGALCIEMKFGKNKQTDNQKEWQKAVEEQGYKYVLCRTVDEFINEVKHYMK